MLCYDKWLNSLCSLLNVFYRTTSTEWPWYLIVVVFNRGESSLKYNITTYNINNQAASKIFKQCNKTIMFHDKQV